MAKIPKLERVLTGLRICMKGLTTCPKECPYYRQCEGQNKKPLMGEIYARLKAYKPRLITPEDFEQADAYGYIPVWQECKIGGGYYTTVSVGILDYGEKGIYRYWTSKPSLKQMEETPWE